MTGERDLVLRGQILRLVVAALFMVLVVNLFIMMIPRHKYYKDQALQNRQVQFRVRAPRGSVSDRQGRVLADNKFIADITVPGTSLLADGPDSTLDRLLTWFDLPREETLDRLRLQRERGQRPLVLVPNATMAQISAVEERGSQLPGVRVAARSRRRYPHHELFAHVIGYVGQVNQSDLDTTGGPDGYRVGDVIGKQGVEYAFEQTLRGHNGIKLEEINASGRIVGNEPVWLRRVEPGRDIQLTLDLDLQNALAEVVGDSPACGVALAVDTGEVLAALSNPAFDPNMMTASISAADWNSLVDDPAKPFFNRIVQATYPPGSLYKPVTSLAGLSLGLVTGSTELEPCLGGWTFGDRFFRCWNRAGHGHINHFRAMAESCDTFYYQLGLMLTIDQLADAARALGLGRTCSGIFPEEVAGNIPDSQWYDRRFGPRGWTRGVLLNNAIGQGEILVTPLQMALMMARLATSGRTPDPVFVVGDIGRTAVPDPLPFAESHLAWVRRALTAVVASGTGQAAQVEGVSVAGKTGTAQNPHGEDHAWFFCFAPADAPEVALALIVENAGSGGSEAAPLAGAWLEAYFTPPSPWRPAGVRPVGGVP